MKNKTCPDCDGTGTVNEETDDERQCPSCGGIGSVSDDDEDDDGRVLNTMKTVG